MSAFILSLHPNCFVNSGTASNFMSNSEEIAKSPNTSIVVTMADDSDSSALSSALETEIKKLAPIFNKAKQAKNHHVALPIGLSG